MRQHHVDYARELAQFFELERQRVSFMGEWTLEEASRVEYFPSLPNPFSGPQLVAGTAHVKGTWVRVCTVPFDCVGLLITIRNNSSATDYLIDIGIGLSGSQIVVIDNIYYTGPTSSARSKNYFFPLRLAAGTQVWARSQNATASANCNILASVFGESSKGAPSCNRIHTYGVFPATSSATPLGAPLANAWGAWTQIVDGTIGKHNWVMPIVGDADLAVRTSQSFAWMVGIGASGAERVLVPPLMNHASSTAFTNTSFFGFWLAVKHQSRLAGRYSAVAATNLGMEMAIYAGSD
jgi:hypothetical protein